MRNLILENDCKQDIPDELEFHLKHDFSENRQYWTQFKSSYWPINREQTMKRFHELKEGDNIVCQTVFDGWLQLEIMAVILDQMKVRLNFYICIYDLQQEIDDYLEERESEFMPNSDEYNDSSELRKEYKQKMNELIKKVVNQHNIYHLPQWGDRTPKLIKL